MAPRTKDHNSSGLGRAIINRKVKDAQRQHDSGLYAADVDSSSRLRSITQERDLDEFLNNAQLAGVDFTAERRNVKIIQQTAMTQNPYLLNAQEERNTLQKHQEHKKRLRVPRRPPWTKSMKPAELEKLEKSSFLEWRRGLAELQDKEHFLLTPFERNLEVWRQLWRVLERSHLLVQIVDARNPLRFRCEDLEAYVADVEGSEGEAGTGKGKRKTLLLINKADLLTVEQRLAWADYFEKEGISFAFYSAAAATALQIAQEEGVVDDGATSSEDNQEDGSEADVSEHISKAGRVTIASEESSDSTTISEQATGTVQPPSSPDESSESHRPASNDSPPVDSRAQVLSVQELEKLFLKVAPSLSEFVDANGEMASKLVVGLVGYPNVGKSSTINSLLGEKKVSVSSTPGKTKHFQTIHLSDKIVLCDCPGLVFPQFATTKADLVCDGVLPIDQMREHTGPTTLVVQRIPKEVLEAIYGLSLRARSVEDGGDGKITAEILLAAYAIARGYMRSGQGTPDEARAARYILKDYVNAKLLFCHPPPGYDARDFNAKGNEIALWQMAYKKKAPTTRVGKDAVTYVALDDEDNINQSPAPSGGTKSKAVDRDFFANNYTLSSRPWTRDAKHVGKEFSRPRMFPHQNIVADDGTPLGSHQGHLIALLENAGNDKKHHKKAKRVKQRSGKGYD